MAKINGTNLLVYYDGLPIGHTTDCELTIDRDNPDASTEGSAGWTEHIGGAGSWSMSCNGLVDWTTTSGADELAAKIIARASLTLKFSTEVSGDTYFTGTGSISSYSISAPKEAPVSYSVSFTGNGALTQTTV